MKAKRRQRVGDNKPRENNLKEFLIELPVKTKRDCSAKARLLLLLLPSLLLTILLLLLPLMLVLIATQDFLLFTFFFLAGRQTDRQARDISGDL